MMDAMVEECYAMIAIIVSLSSCASSFGPTFSAVDWSTRVGLEGNFAFLAAVRADSLVHLSF
jgi:hypothetical protein